MSSSVLRSIIYKAHEVAKLLSVNETIESTFELWYVKEVGRLMELLKDDSEIILISLFFLIEAINELS